MAPAGTFQRFFAPATMGAWTVTEGSVDLSGAGFWQTADGNQSLDLEGTVGIGTGSIFPRDQPVDHAGIQEHNQPGSRPTRSQPHC